MERRENVEERQKGEGRLNGEERERRDRREKMEKRDRRERRECRRDRRERGDKMENLFVLLLYVPSQQLWSLRDGQLT